MKKIKYYFSFLLLALVGCDDKLDIVNPNTQIIADYWQTQDQAQAGVNAIYNSLILDGTYMRMFPTLTDTRGDDITGDTPWLDIAQVGNFTIPTTSGPVQWIWGAKYQLIWRANQVLDNVPAIEMDEALKNRILGQAYFLRGLAYFNLANTYKVVPVVTTAQTVISDDEAVQVETYPATATEEELWNQIFSDFQMAKELLPISYDNVSGPDQGQKGRATKGAATGMLGKAYLYRQQWQNAADQFEQFFTGDLQGRYSLVEDYRDNFKPTNENNFESLFEVQFGSVEEVGGSTRNYGGDPNSTWQQVSSQGYTYAMEGYGYSDVLPTRWIYNEFKEEKTVNGNSDPRLLETIASYEPEDNSTTVYGGTPWPFAEDRIFPRKYTHDGIPGWTDEGGIENSGINYRVLRFADILLMYAEALNELGQTSEAYQYIQQVRDRANLPDLATTKPVMGQQEMRDQLAHERALEFAIEGQRINDIIRWGWLYDPEKLAMLKQHDADFNTWTPGNEYLPIPQTELDVNPNLATNPAN
ncbi:RagB/SusD family nutrient uptake outer membrane protein [Pontibacter silvestris]|uniref:RagB/SusD family nutrient uptake outer membrane protein n=1 Tax=Pontibacter silvestris TaxID=2305183 RepID=A0ABW4X2B5_9BACT|nr:RagB/SusD family nutrient uptake outer membrane protein [Pontibacter silvestris]MCC9134897.1 RagB/SusD family nutrient uptake outer membrane protein [Pontibacter silvestris]